MEAAFIKTLVIYDSEFGNTEKIARVIGAEISAEVKKPGFMKLTVDELAAYDLIIVGSPTQDGKALPSIRTFIEAIPEGSLTVKKIAAFDTRHKWRVVKLWGFAAPRIAGVLKAKGGTLIAPPEYFYVDSTKGPLLDGELERAAAWAKSLTGK